MRNECGILPGVSEHVTPTGHRFGDPEAQEGQGDFGQDELRDQESSLGQNDSHSFRKDVTTDEGHPGCPEPPGPLYVTPLARAHHDTAYEPRGAHPAERADDPDDQEE